MPSTRRPSSAGACRPIAWLLPIALALAACGAERPSPPRNLLLISLDTVRADHLGVYGHERPTSPRLDAWAAEGVVFEEAFATAPWTLPSHASMLTGLHPARHGVRVVHDRLSGAVPTLAARLAASGRATGAVVNVLFLSPAFGLLRGFERVVEVPEARDARGAAGRIVDAGLAWVDARPEPWFLFLHFFDAHVPYRARRDLEAHFVRRRNAEEGSTEQLGRIRDDGAVDPEVADRLARLYDAGIRQLDGELGRLFDALREGGHLGDTLVIVTSDHGEEFGEHGSVSHGHTHHREVLRVPLLVRGQGVARGRRVAHPVSLVDLVPTALDLLGVEPPAGLDGRSLRPLLEASSVSPPEGRRDRPIFAETGPGLEEDHLASLREGRHALLVDREQGRVELYDLEVDPAETRDRADADPALRARLRDRLEAHLAQPRLPAQPAALSEAERERLRALGYLDAP